MQQYFYQKVINAAKLNRELCASSISQKAVKIMASDTDVNIFFDNSLTAEEVLELDSIVQAHTTDDSIVYTQNLVQSAMEFGRSLMIDFAAENVRMGITQAGKTKAVLNYMISVKEAIDTGSLYTAMDEVDALILATVPQDLDPFITEARLLAFKQKILDWLSS